nr:MAG TPA: hypothetical protein [Caudoviricetes sp.]
MFFCPYKQIRTKHDKENYLCKFSSPKVCLNFVQVKFNTFF